MIFKTTTNQKFGYISDITIGTEVIIDEVLKDKNKASGIAFRVFKCDTYPELDGLTLCSSLVSNAQKIIEHFKNDSIKKEKNKLLLIL